jgi:hypothetical protein
MKRNLTVCILIGILNLCLSALQVDVSEIKVDRNIQFVNYTGTHDYIETYFDVRGIGESLAAGLKQSNVPFNYFMKYTVIQAIDDSSSDKYNAVVFSIDKEARVDHINNVRLIISAFLEKKYGYSGKDAATLAYYVTIYNAIYRGNVDYFSGKYKPIVIKSISPSNAGISTKYYEWPGLTRIIIPLTDNPQKGNLSSLNTSELTNKQVKEEVKKDTQNSNKQQNNMITLKEKEIEQKTKEIDKQQKNVDKQKEEIKKEEQKIEQKKQDVVTKNEDITKKEDQLKKDLENANTDEDKKKIEQQLQDVNKQKEDLKKEEDKTKSDQQKVDEKKQDIKKEEQKIEEKKQDVVKKQEEVNNDKKETTNTTTELQKKKEELDKREQNLKESKTDENMLGNNLYYLKIKEFLQDGHYNNEMYLIGAESRKVEVKSELTYICGRKFDVSDKGVIVIAHQGQHTTPHNLVLLDKDTLKIKVRGKDDIFWRSFVETREGMVYAIIKKSDTEYYLGKFNDNLEQVAISKEKVESDTFISFYDKFIYINNPNKEIIVLNKDDLSFVDKIKP